jgi:XRE family transcriptional regulator, fatty acid utilization regulator
MTAQLIGTRIKALRERKNLSQEDLAGIFGFKDRQTVSAIETGERKVSAEELMLAVSKLGETLDYFTDPFRLDGEGKFSWRHTGVQAAKLDAYERLAGRWIAAFRVIAPQVKMSAPTLRTTLRIAKTSTFEAAMEAGELFADEFKLGDVPAARLGDVMEKDLRILVLMVDAFEGISGAACRLPEVDAVLINRNENIGRRNFDLAHELFHILTWDAMPPEHSESSAEYSANRVEQLANNFASALLMPKRVLARFGDWANLDAGELVAKLKSVADELQVTASALKWRLVALGVLKQALGKEIKDTQLRNNGHAGKNAEKSPLFSHLFTDVLGKAIDQGRVSLRRAAGLVDLTTDEMIELFAIHGVAKPDGV